MTEPPINEATKPSRWRVPPIRERLVEGFLIVALAGLLYALWRPEDTSEGRIGPRRPTCRTHLHQLGFALHSYHEDHGSFPPAWIADAEGRPMHSWRVLILPYLDQAPLYKEYRFDEPWDGPNNRRLAARIPSYYCCPDRYDSGEHVPHTGYFAIAGPGTAFPGATPTRLDDIRDGSSETLLIVCSPGVSRNWMQPDDITPAELDSLLAGVPEDEFPHAGGIWVTAADGAVRFLEREIASEKLRALCTIAGGEPVDDF